MGVTNKENYIQTTGQDFLELYVQIKKITKGWDGQESKLQKVKVCDYWEK